MPKAYRVLSVPETTVSASYNVDVLVLQTALLK